MTTWTARRLAWALGICSILLLLASLVLMFVDRGRRLPDNVGSWTAADVLSSVVSLGVPVLGIVIANKRPSNAIGWVFIAAGFALGIGTFGQSYALHALRAVPGSLPAGRALAWVSNVVWPISIFGLILLFLLFPTGHLASPRWRPVAWLAGAIFVLLTIGVLILATVSWNDPFEGINVQGGDTARWARLLIVLAAFALPVALVLAVVSVAMRFRRSTGVERLQLKWFVSASAVTAITFSVGFFVDSAVVSLVSTLSLLGLYVAIGIAMLKHNLYDIDVIINRTIVYGTLAAFITVTYVLVVVVIGAIIGVTEGLSLLTTAIVAVAFQPIRKRAEHVANRLVYGERATPYEVLSRFSEHVGEAYGGEDILVRMAKLLAEGTGAGSAAIWLKVGSTMRPTAVWPKDAPTIAAVDMAGEEPPRFDAATTAVAVRHRGQLLGLLTVTKPPNEPMSGVEQALVADLAGQAGLMLANFRLIEDLRGSRQRLVTAQDEERRRIERDLHDGAQQQLVALAIQLKLARATASTDPAKADQMLQQLEGNVTDALEDLRELARGVYPPLLADKGLAAAIEAQSRRAPLPVHVEATGVGRYAPDVEAAVYFCALEALQNTAKYADATEVIVRLVEDQGELVFEVGDDGRGFDPAAKARGSGLQNMSDRLSALDGEITVRSRTGVGTTVVGRLPVRSDVLSASHSSGAALPA